MENKLQTPLSQKLFIKRLELAQNIKNKEEQLKLLSGRLKDILHNEVKNMNLDNFIVRPNRREVEKYSDRDIWENLNPEEILEIRKKLSGLPSETLKEDEFAKRFDLMILNMQLGILDNYKFFKNYQKKMKGIAGQLEEKKLFLL